MHLAQTSIFNLAVGIQKWQKKKEVIPQELKNGHSQLIRLCIDSRQPFPNNVIPQLVAFLKKPFKEWGIEAILNFFEEELRLMDDVGELTDYFQEWIEVVGSIENEEQKKMKQILDYCRGQSLEKEYTEIRRFISEHPIIQFIDLKKVSMNYGEKLGELITKCYKQIELINEVKVCPYCGWTLQVKRGQWTCTKLCRSLADFTVFQTVKQSNSPYYRLHQGIQRFVMLPGKAEVNMFDNLKKKYKNAEVTLYPEVDLFDIRVKRGDVVFHLDMKDYTHPHILAEYFHQEGVEKFIEHEQTVVVIPNYREQLTPGYIKRFYKKAEELGLECPFDVMLEKDCIKRMDRVLMI